MSAVDPLQTVEARGEPKLRAIAEEVEQKLRRALDRL